jgi:hypothetical protein
LLARANARQSNHQHRAVSFLNPSAGLRQTIIMPDRSCNSKIGEGTMAMNGRVPLFLARVRLKQVPVRMTEFT